MTIDRVRRETSSTTTSHEESNFFPHLKARQWYDRFVGCEALCDVNVPFHHIIL
jgi:hypothetical protein